MAKKNHNKVDQQKKEETVVEIVEEKVEKKVEEKVGKVIGCDRLNVRSKPTLKGDVLCVITKGTSVTITDDKPNSKWFKITVENVNGFCMKQYIEEA